MNFTYKYYPVVDQGQVGESTWAAEAAECANQQSRFWEYHHKLFQVWAGENVGTYAKPKLKQYAAELGLDTGNFNQCLDTDRTLPVIQADTAEATRLGVHETPTFLINGRILPFSLDYGYFSRLFDSSLQ